MSTALRRLPLFIALSGTAFLAACGGGSSGTTATGTLQVSMTDAPACGFDAVNVTVSKVRAHQSASASDTDAGWADITLNPAHKINLVDLVNGKLEDLGQTTLPVGHYTQMRLVLAANASGSPLANSVIPSGGTEIALDTPSAIQSGIKLVGQFDVSADAQTALALDFDACKSVVTKGNGGYLLKPVIGLIPMASSGSISGVVDPALAGSKPVVTAQLNGVIVKSTVPDTKGAFTLSPLDQSSDAGNYAVVITADGHASDVITGVPVTANADTVLSTTTTPLTLPTSATNTVSGTVSPATAEAEMNATQSLASGTAVTIKYQEADLTTGAYSLTLPTAAPMLGQFGTLPVALNAQSAAAGKYSVEASATGYQTQSIAITFNGADIVSNFTLK